MKKTTTIFLFIMHCALCIVHHSVAQNPLVKKWDHRYGGTDEDWVSSFKQTTDGGFILCGTSKSGQDGDKTQANWGVSDYWIVKVDSLGNKEWDKDFGGDNEEVAYDILQSSDKGYLIGGFSNSGISGDKTEPNIGMNDFWVVKTDSLGNKQWDRTFGAPSDDPLTRMIQTRDGGFIIGGWSSLGMYGIWDYWIIKLDTLGNLVWEKIIGGTGSDMLWSLNPTFDGGFILGGYSESGIGGLKTTPNKGALDYWIVKVDSIGTIQWDKDFGGTSDDMLFTVSQTSDSGCILGGTSNSSAGGDKSQNSWGLNDFWILKLDSIGNKIWDRDYGGTGSESGWNRLVQETSSGYLMIGASVSPVSGDKTESNLGIVQAWIVNTDSIGNVSWDKTVFTAPDYDSGPNIIQTRDQCYVIAVGTYGAVAGNKSEPNRDSTNSTDDFWIVKFCDSTFIQANLTADQNLCFGECTDFINLSINATSYQWSFPGATPDTSSQMNPTNICYPIPGTYDVILIASNTNYSDTIILQNFINVFFQQFQSIIQSGDTLFAIAGSSSYQWYFNGNLISGATDYFYVATASGDYNVVATDTNGCEVEAVINDVVASIQYTVDSKQITAFPNPVTTALDIRGLKNNSADEIKIFNVYGEKVFSAVNCKLSAQSDPSFGGPIANCQLFPAGLYYLEITSDKKIYRTKFIKQ